MSFLRANQRSFSAQAKHLFLNFVKRHVILTKEEKQVLFVLCTLFFLGLCVSILSYPIPDEEDRTVTLVFSSPEENFNAR